MSRLLALPPSVVVLAADRVNRASPLAVMLPLSLPAAEISISTSPAEVSAISAELAPDRRSVNL